MGDLLNQIQMGKSQGIRLLDVFLLGPFMVYFSYKAKGVSDLERNLMYALGVATVLYNAKNYLVIKQTR